MTTLYEAVINTDLTQIKDACIAFLQDKKGGNLFGSESIGSLGKSVTRKRRDEIIETISNQFNDIIANENNYSTWQALLVTLMKSRIELYKGQYESRFGDALRNVHEMLLAKIRCSNVANQHQEMVKQLSTMPINTTTAHEEILPAALGQFHVLKIKCISTEDDEFNKLIIVMKYPEGLYDASSRIENGQERLIKKLDDMKSAATISSSKENTKTNNHSGSSLFSFFFNGQKKNCIHTSNQTKNTIPLDL